MVNFNLKGRMAEQTAATLDWAAPSVWRPAVLDFRSVLAFEFELEFLGPTLVIQYLRPASEFLRIPKSRLTILRLPKDLSTRSCRKERHQSFFKAYLS